MEYYEPKDFPKEFTKKGKDATKELYDLIGTYVQDGKVLTKKEWELIGGILNL